MVTWPSGDLAPDMTDDDLLSTEPFSMSEPVPKVEASILGFFVHAVRYSEILLEVLKYVSSFSISTIRLSMPLVPKINLDFSLLYTQPPPHDRDTDLLRFQDTDYHYQLLRLDSLLKKWRSQLPEHLVISADENVVGDNIALSQAIATLCR